MRNSIYLCCTWLVLLIGTAIVVEADTVTVQELLQEYGREELCKQIETNSMAGFSYGSRSLVSAIFTCQISFFNKWIFACYWIGISLYEAAVEQLALICIDATTRSAKI